MWQEAACALLLFTLAECSPQTHIYRYNQALAITPHSDKPATALPNAPPTLSGLDVQLLQDVFGLPNASAVNKDTSPDVFKPSYEAYDEFDWKLTKVRFEG